MWFTRFSPVLPVSKIINTASITSLSDETKKMYEVPFRNKRKTAIRRLPNILPLYEKHIEASLSNAVWEKLRQSNIPLLTIFSSNDPYTAEGAILLQEKIPGSSGESHTKLLAGHFITEDAPTELANCISGFINKYRDDK
jgi:haloalkane dehalogenase